MHIPNLSGRQTFAIAATIGLGLSHLAAWQAGRADGFEEGRNPYTVPVQPDRVVCGPQYGLHDVAPGETADGIAARYNIDTLTMLRLNNKLNPDETFTPESLTDSDCLRVDSIMYATPPESMNGTPPGQIR